MATPTGNKRANESDSAEQPDTKRTKPDLSDTITVLIGEEEQKFLVHKDVACSKSPFFKAACDERKWSEGKEGVVKLPEHDPETFSLFLPWVYSDKLAEGDDDSAEALRRMARTWSLADYLGATTLSNLVIDKILSWNKEFDTWPGPALFEHISPGTAIWRLWVDLVAGEGIPEYMEDAWSEEPEALLDINQRLMSEKDKKWLDPSVRPGCYYHNHPEGEPKCP